MKTIKLCFFVVSSILILAGAALAADFVDIGDPVSETGHLMTSWGPIEPGTHGGTYGGIDDCRAIWSNFDTPTPGSIDAFIDLSFSGTAELLSFKHLDGGADDSFEVWLGGTMVFMYMDSGQTTETWYVSSVAVNMSAGVHTVQFVATGAQWPSWGTYGQVCFAEVGVGGVVATDYSTWGNVKSLFR